MGLVRVEPNKSLALARVNTLLGRVFSVAATFIAFQTFANAMSQYAEQVLTPFWFWTSVVLLAAAHLLIIFLVWFVGDGKTGFAALTLVTAFLIVTWSLQIGDNTLAPGEQPWIWWAVGIGALSAVGGFGVFLSGFFLIIFPSMWFFLQISDIGTPVEPFRAFQDAVFSFLFSSVLAGFVWVLRYESSRVDEANYAANQAAIDLARTDAMHRERDRIDALIHDSVLTTLLVASTAEDDAARQNAKKLAAEAIAKLTSEQMGVEYPETISVNSLFSALEVAVLRQDPSAEVEAEGATDALVPGEVASAVAEATLQALTNAVQHAGANAKIQVFLKGTAKGIKIVVKDDGRGFRPARVPKNRLGLKLSIFGRVHAVGGKAFIDSKIGVGTNVIIEWSAK